MLHQASGPHSDGVIPSAMILISILILLGLVLGPVNPLWIYPSMARTASNRWSLLTTAHRVSFSPLRISSSLSSSSSSPMPCSTSSSSLPSSILSTTTKRKKLFSFTEARKIARGHGFQSHEEFVEYSCPGAYQVPKNADEVWSLEWTSWDDFLGIPWSFEAGRLITRTLNLTLKEEYLILMESKTIADDSPASRLPYRPDLHYKHEWKGWDDWLLMMDSS